MSYKDSKARFLRLYKQMRPADRRKLVLTMDGQPYTWNPIYIEVVNDTKLASVMLAQMETDGTM